MNITLGTRLTFAFNGTVLHYKVMEDSLENIDNRFYNSQLFDLIKCPSRKFCERLYEVDDIFGWPRNKVSNDFSWIPKMLNTLESMGVKCYVDDHRYFKKKFYIIEDSVLIINGKRHVVKYSYLSCPSEGNDWLFKKVLGWDDKRKYEEASMCYGYDAEEDGIWPYYKDNDYDALERLLQYIQTFGVSIVQESGGSPIIEDPTLVQRKVKPEKKYIAKGILEHIEEKFALTIEKEQEIKLKFT